MRKRASASILCLALGTSAAWAVTAYGDPGMGATPIIERTVTQTRTVHRRIEGHGVEWWRSRAVHNRRAINRQRAALRDTRAALRYRWAPTVDYAISLASRVYGVPESKMRSVAYCESTMNPLASNGRYRGLFQLGWSPFGLSPYDPVANALSAAQTVSRDGSWRQWECG